MKEFKENVINKMIEKSQDMRIVSLRETAAELGINHISAQDTRDIAQRLRKVEGYHLVQMMNTPNDSLFCSLCLVENGVEFDDGKDFESDAESVNLGRDRGHRVPPEPQARDLRRRYCSVPEGWPRRPHAGRC